MPWYAEGCSACVKEDDALKTTNFINGGPKKNREAFAKAAILPSRNWMKTSESVSE